MKGDGVFHSPCSALGGQRVPPRGRSTHPTLSLSPGQGQVQDGLSGRGALLCPSCHPHPAGSVVGSARLQDGLCAGLQLPLVPLPPLAARARRGPGVAVPVEDGFAFAAPGKRGEKTKPTVLVTSEQRPNFSH